MAVLTLAAAGARGWFCGMCTFAVAGADSEMLRALYLHVAVVHGMTIEARTATKVGEWRDLTAWVLS